MEEKNKKNNINWQEINAKYRRISFRLNTKEQSIFNDLFKKSTEKFEGAFIKKCIFFGGADYKETEELNKELLKSNQEIRIQLRKIGTNINQIATKINVLNEFSKEDNLQLLNEIESLKELIYVQILRK